MEMSPSFLRMESNRRLHCLFHCTSSAWFHSLESISTRAVFPTPVSPSMITGTPHWYLLEKGGERGEGERGEGERGEGERSELDGDEQYSTEQLVL